MASIGALEPPNGFLGAPDGFPESSGFRGENGFQGESGFLGDNGFSGGLEPTKALLTSLTMGAT